MAAEDPAGAPPRKIDPGLVAAVLVGCALGAYVVKRAAEATPPRARAGLTAALPNSVPVEQRPDVTVRCTGDAWALAFTPDGKGLLAGDRDGLALWDAEDGDPLRKLDTKGTGVRALSLTGNGRYAAVAVAYADEVRLLPAEEGVPGGPVPLREAGKVPSVVALSPDDRLLAAGGIDGKLRVWDAGALLEAAEPGRVYDTTATAADQAAKRSPRLTLPVGATVDSVAFSPDGSRVAVAAANKVLVFDTATGGAPVLTLSDKNTGTLRAVRYTPDGKRLIGGTGGQGGPAGLVAWDAATGAPSGSSGDFDAASGSVRAATGGADALTALAVSRDGFRIAAAHRHGVTVIHDGATLKPLCVLDGSQRDIGAVALSPDGRSVAAGSKDGKVTVWRLQ